MHFLFIFFLCINYQQGFCYNFIHLLFLCCMEVINPMKLHQHYYDYYYSQYNCSSEVGGIGGIFDKMSQSSVILVCFSKRKILALFGSTLKSNRPKATELLMQGCVVIISCLSDVEPSSRRRQAEGGACGGCVGEEISVCGDQQHPGARLCLRQQQKSEGFVFLVCIL